MDTLAEYRHCWKGLHVYPKQTRQCPCCQGRKKAPTCALPPNLKICRKGLHLYPVKDKGCAICNRIRAKNWYINNPQEHYANVKKWIKNNPEKKREVSRNWFKNHKTKANELAARRRARKKSQTPAWADLKKIQKIYEECPSGFHVDHIYPLKSQIMCGLHVENNLQYLSAKDNMAKGNRVTLAQQLSDS